MEPSRILILISGIAVILTVFSLLLWSTRSSTKERDKLYRIKHAEKKWYHGLCITPVTGQFFVRVSEHQWVEVMWDKKEKTITILTPPNEWERIKKFPITRYEPNWKIVGECQPKPVTIEEYFVRQVM